MQYTGLRRSEKNSKEGNNMKNEFLNKAIISGTLWVFTILMFALLPVDQIGWTLIPCVALSIILGKGIIHTISDVTGLVFYTSIYALVILYIVIAAVSIFCAPIYCLWNLYKHYRHKG